MDFPKKQEKNIKRNENKKCNECVFLLDEFRNELLNAKLNQNMILVDFFSVTNQNTE